MSALSSEVTGITDPVQVDALRVISRNRFISKIIDLLKTGLAFAFATYSFTIVTNGFFGLAGKDVTGLNILLQNENLAYLLLGFLCFVSTIISISFGIRNRLLKKKNINLRKLLEKLDKENHEIDD